MPAYYHELLESCHVEECMDRAARMMNWEEKFPRRDMGNGKVRGVGVGISMQGSGISGVDVGTVSIRLADSGHYNMMIGATDMGTGCDTILAQIAADCWSAMWIRLWFPVWIQIILPMIPDPMLPAPPT